MELSNLTTVTGFLVGRTKSEIKLLSDLDPDSKPVSIAITNPISFSRCLRNDIVSCEVDASSNLTGSVLISRSLVVENHTIASMIAAVRQNGKLLVIPTKLARLHHYIEDRLLSAQLSTVSQFLSYKANLHNSSFKKAVLRSLNVPFLDRAEMTAILRGWYTENDVRLLECVGISRESLRESYFRADILYSLYMENPMLLYCVPLEQAIPASRLLGVPVPSYREAAIALRDLADSTVLKWNHSCVDCSAFYRKHKLPRASIDQLLERAVVPDTCDGNGVLYLRELRDMEVYVAARFSEIMKAELPPVGDKGSRDRDLALDYDREQARAVDTALKSNISIVNGAAGTGKTTIVRQILTRLKLNGVQVACTSFTGCATARISDCCGVEAEDMDLMIVKSDDYSFSHLIIDEFSMTSIRLMYSFLQAFPERFRITIIGDVNQLEPIGPGSVLKELIKSHCIPVTTLRTIHRVKTKDGVTDRIIENSKRIAYWEDKPFSFVQGDNFTVRDGTIGTMMGEIVSMHKRDVPLSSFVIISPWKQPIALINRAVQAQYNSGAKCCVRKGGKWSVHNSWHRDLDITNLIYHVGDRVMILKNKSGNKRAGETDPGELVAGDEAKLFNGQEGVITDVSMQGIEVDVKRAGRILFPYSSGSASPLDVSFFTLSYAVTVHKMQGKQCKLAIYYIGQEWSSFLTRNMTYTAITRAEEEVLLIGNPQNFNKSVNNVPKDKREYLYWRLRELLPQDYNPEKDDRMMEELRERQYQANLAAAAEAAADGDYDDYDYDSD